MPTKLRTLRNEALCVLVKLVFPLPSIRPLFVFRVLFAHYKQKNARLRAKIPRNVLIL